MAASPGLFGGNAIGRAKQNARVRPLQRSATTAPMAVPGSNLQAPNQGPVGPQGSPGLFGNNTVTRPASSTIPGTGQERIYTTPPGASQYNNTTDGTFQFVRKTTNPPLPDFLQAQMPNSFVRNIGEAVVDFLGPREPGNYWERLDSSCCTASDRLRA